MKITLSIIALLFCSLTYGQNLRIEFTNSNGEAISFASVQNVHSKDAWITDAEGELYYQLFSESDTIEVHSLGYEVTQFILNNKMKSPVKLQLVHAYNELGAVEVNGIAINAFGFTKNNINASSMYLDKKSLSKIESNDVHQILYAVPGIQIQQEDGFGLRPNIGMRGTGVERSSKITLMEDGVLIAPAPYAASAAYYFPSMDHIESIEVLKGSSQIAYGPQTNGGAINLISDRIPTDFQVKLKASLGSYLTRKVQGSVGGSSENYGYLVKGTYFGSNGFKELPNSANTGFDKSDVLAKLRFNTNKDSKIYQAFTTKFAYTQENTNETYLGLTQEDFDMNPLARYKASENDNIQSTHTTIQFSHLIQPIKNLKINTTIYLNKFSRNWFKLDKVSTDGSTKVGIASILDNPSDFEDEYNLLKGESFLSSNRLYLKNNNRSYTSKGLQSNLYYNFETGSVKHKINSGFRIHQDEMDRFQWNDTYTMTANGLAIIEEGVAGTESNRIESAKAFSGFLQYGITYKFIALNAGVRYEYMHFKKDDFGKSDVERMGTDLTTNENKTSVVLPGATISFQLKNQNYLFAGVHKGFSPPNSNEETIAEESWNFELGSKGSVKGFGYELVGFANRYDNLLGSDLMASGGAGSTDLFNGGAVAVYGVEAMLSYNILRKISSELKLPFSLSYTYTNAQFQSDFESDGPWGVVSTGDFLPYISNHQLFTQLGLEHKRFDVNVMAKVLSAMRTQPGQGDFEEENSTPLLYQLDLLVRFKLNQTFSFFGKVNNLTNTVRKVSKHPSGWRPNMPIFVEGGVEVRF